MGTPRADISPLHVSRREILIAGSAAMGALVLAGCQGGGGSSGASTAPVETPPVRWPSDQTAVAASVHSDPTPAPRVQPQPTNIPDGVIPRSQWTRAGIARPNEIFPMNGISRITVHHDAIRSEDVRSQAEAAARLEQIRRSHIARPGKPFADIGYHYIIDPAGRVWEGRSIQHQGAHVQDNNEHNLGIMVMGNFNQQSPTNEQRAAVNRFVALQMRKYNIPVQRLYTHQEIKSTECPGRSLQAYMNQVRSRGGALARA